MCLAEAENVFVRIVARGIRVYRVRTNVDEAERDLCTGHDVAAIFRAHEGIGVIDQWLRTIGRLAKRDRTLTDYYGDAK